MGTPVKLYVYDLSQGVARMMSTQLIGRQIEGIWHSSIVVYEREYCFGSEGIMSTSVGGTVLGLPHEIVDLGETHVSYSVFKEYLQGLKESTFAGSTYNLLRHNCNHFTDEVAQFLCGSRIPKHILDLPDIILESQIGPIIVQLVGSLSKGPTITSRSGFREDSPEFEQLNSAIEEVRRSSIALRESRKELNEKLAKKEKKRKKKLRKEEKERQRIREIERELERNGYKFRPLPQDQYNRMAENEEALQNVDTNGVEEFDVSATTQKARDVVAEIEAEEQKELEEIRRKQRDPPIVFRDALDVKVEFDTLVGLIDGKLTPEEQKSMEELHQYMLENEGSWALGDGFLNFIGRLLNDKTFGPDVRIRTINILACAALKDDVILLLHQDRRDHIIMNYAGEVERLTTNEQQALSLFFANLFEHMSSSEWLLYISEWQYQNNNLSNIRVTTKVGINALLSENSNMQDYGSAIIHNMACKEKMHQNKRLRRLLPPGSISKVFDDVAIELTMALLQFLNNKPNEELLFRAMKSLARLCQISGQDVSQMIQMIGPEPIKFKGISTRIDEQIAEITKKLR